MGFLSDLGDVAGAVGGLVGAFGGSGESKSEKGARRSAEAARLFALDAANPESERFKSLAALFEEADRRHSVEAIQRAMRLQARARARGDPGFIVNPERRDEARYRALANQFMMAKERSRQEARNTLIQAAQAATGAAGAYPVQTGFLGNQLDMERYGSGIQALPSVGRTLENAFTSWGNRGNPQYAGGYSDLSGLPYVPT